MIGIETGLEHLRVLQAAYEQSRADERHERKRNLRDHQRVSHATFAPSAADCARFVFERGNEFGL